MTDTIAETDAIEAEYFETDEERILHFRRDTDEAVIAQNTAGYAMLKVRPSISGDELERYYGFEMALDHAAELLGVDPGELPVPAAATDMGM
ncbi:MAG: hypothetical protein ABEH65_04910 [Halobacteriales archaeon]